jgi:hypothetical protein
MMSFIVDSYCSRDRATEAKKARIAKRLVQKPVQDSWVPHYAESVGSGHPSLCKSREALTCRIREKNHGEPTNPARIPMQNSWTLDHGGHAEFVSLATVSRRILYAGECKVHEARRYVERKFEFAIDTTASCANHKTIGWSR